MKRRLLPILMTLVLVCALPIWAAFVTSGDVTNPLVCTAGASELNLQGMIGQANAGATITLNSNTEIAATLQITKNLTLDLNGCVLRMRGTGSVLKVSDRATLTITDSRPQNPHTGSYVGLPAGGVITGGEGTDVTGIYNVGGAVFLENDTTLKLEGGTITGNSSCGSVFISDEKAVFEMSGGTITGETVGVRNNVGTFTMTGGRITGCRDRGVYVHNGNMTMSGTAYIGENPNARREDIYVYESDHKHTDLSVTGGTIAGNVRIIFLESLRPTQDDLKAVANSVVKEQGVFNGHIKVGIDDQAGTCVDYNTVNFIDEVAKTRTRKLVLQPNAVEEPEAPATVNGQAFKYWAAKGSSEAWDFNTLLEVPLTLYAVRTPASSGGYYYYPTTDTKTDDAKGSPKTADPGVALYGVLSLLSLTGLTCTTKKR
ncbi:MAG: hypothetical protein MR907_00330 [Firmicutes bacterium]|nr:hypothetical protein [Bacillota bacterium]